MFEEDELTLYGGYGPQPVTATGLTLRGGLMLAGVEALAATAQCGDHEDPTPRAIEGPFYKPLSPMRFDFREPGETGQIVELTGTVLTRSCRPVPGAVVDLWHANKTGDYDNAGFRYRGHIVTNADGKYRFLTIKPGAYGDFGQGTGRTVHYHVIVRAPKVWPFTTQFYFPDDTDNLRDEYFRHDLVMRVAQAGEGFTAGLDIVLETFRNP
jgi:protocatechuate 3,4-dioxygenase beta subunit